MAHLTASLADVCDIRFSPISEAEAWSILYQGCKTMRELFITGSVWDGRSPSFLITPDTLQLCPEGSVEFAENLKQMSQSATNFMPPEVLMGNTPRLGKQLEAMHVFSLGAVVFWALMFKNLRKKEQISDQLRTMLSKMLQKIPALRSTLEDVLDASTQQVGELGGAPQPFVKKMVECLLGSSEKQEEMVIPDIMKYFPTKENVQPVNRSAFYPVSPANSLPDPQSVFKPIPNRYPGYGTGAPGPSGQNNPADPWGSPKQYDPYYNEPTGYNAPRNPEPTRYEYTPHYDNLPGREKPNRATAEEHWNSTENLLNDEPFRARATSTTDFERYASGKPSTAPQFSPIKDQDTEADYRHESGSVREEDENADLKSHNSRKPPVDTNFQDTKQKKQRGKLQLNRSSDSRPTGPEFLQWSSQPPEVIEIPFQTNYQSDGLDEDESSENMNKIRQVQVELPNGRKLDVTCDVNTTVQDIFDAIVTHLTLIEHSFFGLTYFSDDEYYFLEFPEKLSNVSPDSWRHGITSSFTLYFQVKFYAPDIKNLKHQLTRHSFYLQLRKDLLNDKFDCSEDLALILGSLALQAEYGDMNQQMVKANYFRAEHYVATSVIAYLGHDNVQATLSALHGASCGLTTDEAEGKLIMECCKINDYGRHFYKLFFNEDRNTTIPVHIGISTAGLDCWKLDDEDEMFREDMYFFSWDNIKSVSYKKRKFIIEAAGVSTEDTGEDEVYEYITDSQKKGRYLLQLCSSHHKFQTAIVQASTIPRNREPQNDFSHENEEEMVYRMDQQEPGVSHIYSNPTPSKPSRDSMNAPRKPARETIVEREIQIIQLQKKPRDDDIGLVLTGSETGNTDLGVTVKQVIHRGVAAQDGRLHPGDKIIAVNGRSLEGLTGKEAQERLEQAPRKVELVVSKPVNPTAGKRDGRDEPKMGREQNIGYLPVYKSSQSPGRKSPEADMYSRKDRRDKGSTDKLFEPVEANLPDLKDEQVKPEIVQSFNTQDMMKKPREDKAEWALVPESELRHAIESPLVPNPGDRDRNRPSSRVSNRGGGGAPTNRNSKKSQSPPRANERGGNRKSTARPRNSVDSYRNSTSEDPRVVDAMQKWLKPNQLK